MIFIRNFQRYHKLWHKKTENWAADADKIILKVADEMNLGILPSNVPSQGQDVNYLVDDDDEDVSTQIGQLSTSSQPTSHQRQEPRTQGHDFDAFSAERELTNFLTQTNMHFQTCK